MRWFATVSIGERGLFCHGRPARLILREGAAHLLRIRATRRRCTGGMTPAGADIEPFRAAKPQRKLRV